VENKVPLVLILGIALLIFATDSRGESTCAGTYQTDSRNTALSYGPRDHGRYCDGTVYVRNGGRLETVAAMVGNVQGKPGESPVHLRLLEESLPSGVPAGAVRLNGQSYAAQGDYRFDALLVYGTIQMDVGPESALAHLGMDASNVGWLASMGEFLGKRLVIPVSGTGPQNDSTIVLFVRPTLHVTASNYQIIVDGRIIEEGHGTQSAKDGSLFEFKIGCGISRIPEIKIWTTSPAGDVESDGFYLLRNGCSG
jgi:hypothetical protein